MPMNKEQFIRDFIEDIWNQKDFQKIQQYIHERYTIYLDTADPWEKKTLDHEEFKKRLHYSFDSFPDMHFEITSAIEEDNHVAINWILTGTHLGSIGEVPPTHRKIKTTGLTIYHFKGNLISGHTQVFDRKTVMHQLGFL